MDRFTDSLGKKFFLQFRKLVPGIKLTLKEKTPRSTVSKFVQWKTFFINEGMFRFFNDTVITGTDTAIKQKISTPKENRYLNQLKFVYENYRALYPFDIQLQVEQAKHFIKPALTANYFLNYAEGNGMQVRFFAGKFIYTQEKTISNQFETERYHLNLSGASGYEDYTYSDYFIARNKFEGLASQQIKTSDGAFKVRTELLAEKVGKTDDWLMAVNFNSPFPQKLNPLSVLPIKIPLYVFADVGTYAEAWDRTADTDRFLFDAGFHLPLFNKTINIYFPVIYSNVYREYFKSTIIKNRLFKAATFSINLNHQTIGKLKNQLGL
ncbi:MAG: hypothetical protein ICV66_05205 [Chitinophagaceae bacterium]|nr:hypothetical protein [Chitinophagaceae bacterium]